MKGAIIMAHLSLSERIKIESMLESGISLNKIAENLQRSPSTISREIIKHLEKSDKVFYGRIPNRCINRKTCTIKNLCKRYISDCRKSSCSLCKYCNLECLDFQEEICENLSSSPYVCNGCKNQRKCTLHKCYYFAETANTQYKVTLVKAREGVNLTELELSHIDKLFSNLLMNGQSIYQIFTSNPKKMIRSEKSIYRYVNQNLLSAKNIDLPRVVKMKPRKSKSTRYKIDKKCYIGRTYLDFQKYLINNPDANVVEMDTVEGVKGGKVLLTLHFKDCNDFMLAFIRDYNNAQSVIDIFNDLYSKLKPDLFERLFQCVLTDRGSEFSNPSAIEKTIDNKDRANVFYCDPMASWQKANVEVNHEFIRRILPKGVSFDNLNQDDVNLMMNHINSYRRKKLNDKSPISLLGSLYGKELLELFNAKEIASNDIILHPKLLKK